jgi:hypothetical protein
MKATLLISEEDLASFRACACPTIQIAIDLCVITKQPLAALLFMQWDHIEWSGVEPGKVRTLHTRRIVSKKAMKIPFQVGPDSPPLHEIFMRAIKLPPDFPKDYILRDISADRCGMRFHLPAFTSLWNREMRKWVSAAPIRTKFSFAAVRLLALSRTPIPSKRKGH